MEWIDIENRLEEIGFGILIFAFGIVIYFGLIKPYMGN